MPKLIWIGKEAVVNHHREVPFHLLKNNDELSVGDPGSGNLLVQGDNLIALKALLPYYAKQVKCIYIDPPYNTGNENWVYNDNVNSPEIKAWLGRAVGKEAEDLSRHDKWLCMMYPRLALLREFLRDDGAIFISIDDNEYANLCLLIREIFGAQNDIATLVWEKGKKGDSKLVSVTHEYIVLFARNKGYLTSNKIKWRKRKAGVDAVLQYYADLCVSLGNNHTAIRKAMMSWYRSLDKKDPRKAHKHYSWSDDRGLYFAADFAGPDDGRESRPRYDIIHPTTGKPCAKPSTGWRWEEETTQLALAEIPPRIHFGKDETTIPNRKSYLFEVDQEPMMSVFYKDGRAATLEVEGILGAGAFPFPKDSDLLAELIGVVTEDDDIVLDSFAGSGTTGHAVAKLNQSDGGHRKFILVEMDTGVCQTKTRTRLKKAVEGYTYTPKKGKPSSVSPLGGGFRFCELGEPLFDERGNIRSTVRFADLARHVYFTETGEPLPALKKSASPLLGVHNGTGVYLLYNGILKDKTPDGGNVLTTSVLASLPRHDGSKVIYGAACRLGAERLRREQIVFKQLPYKLKVGVL
jgi:adenine-specific DNA-methyltransferase